MADRLLDRQAALLAYLTSRDAVFVDAGERPTDAALEGIDPALLRLEARFSHEKRMGKIAAVLPRTFDLLGENLDAVARAFVEACPPADIDRLVNAARFVEIVGARWRDMGLKLPHLPDVAACELAIARARTEVGTADASQGSPSGNPRPALRRRAGVVLLRLAHDVRAVFESRAADAVSIERETLLAIAVDGGAVGIVELAPAVFDLLAALDRWESAEGPAVMEGLVAELAEAGLLELRR